MASPKKPESKVVPFAGDPEVNPTLSRSLGLSEAEVARATKELGRAPAYAELVVLSTMWSERESQKSARVHSRRLSASSARVVLGGEDGAGAVDLGDGTCAVFALQARDAEDPAHAATFALGDALRDVLAMGARPVAALDSLRLGAADSELTAEVLKSTAARLSEYATHTGVPVVGGDLQFDPRYERPVIKALAVGVMRTEALLERRATGLGNTLLCVGGKTGAENDQNQEPADASVQRRLVDACLEAYRLGSIEGARGVGASGIAGAAVLLAARGDTGVELDLDLLPRKSKGISPADLLGSSSTERMLLVVKKGREDSVLEVFRRHDLDAAVVGRVTNTGRIVVKATPDHEPLAGKSPEGRQGIVADMPVSLLVQEAPSYERPSKVATIDRSAPTVSLKRNEDAESELVRLVGSANVGSREWLSRRLEGAGKTSAARGPVGDAAVVRASERDGESGVEKLLALSVDGNGRHCALDPRAGAAMAVAECARNAVCVGAEPLGVVHSLSFGSAEDPETIWRLSETVDGIRDACLALKLPVVSGKIGFTPAHTLTAPVVAVLGQVRDADDRLGMGFARQADMVALLGAPGAGNLAGSEMLVSRSGGELRGEPLQLDLGAEVKLQRAVLELARERLLSSAHDVSDGGLGVCLAECCIAGRIGCSVELPGPKDATDLAKLFHEAPSRVVVSFAPEQRAKVQERCENLGVPFTLLGFVGGDTLEIEDVLDVPVQVLAESHSRALTRLVGE